jgi:hypothetical protein
METKLLTEFYHLDGLGGEPLVDVDVVCESGSGEEQCENNRDD